MPGFPLPGLPFHCQPQTAPAWAHCASRNANYSFLAGCSTLPGPHPSSDPAVHGKSALGYGRRGERSHGVLENPTGREGTAAPASSSARDRVGQDWSDPTRSTPTSPLPALAPSQQLPTPQKHQTNTESRESTRNSSSTAPQTGSRCQHRTLNSSKPPQGQFCAVPATNTGPEHRQQSCPCSSRAVPVPAAAE